MRVGFQRTVTIGYKMRIHPIVLCATTRSIDMGCVSTMDNSELLAAFEACTVSRPEWAHEAHVRVAWIYAWREHSVDNVCNLMRTGIRRLGAAFGTGTTRYHETVTIAFSVIITDRTARADSPDWESFKSRNSDLFDRESPILLKFYSRDVLYSDTARAEFVPPDLQPLPISPTPNAAVAL